MMHSVTAPEGQLAATWSARLAARLFGPRPRLNNRKAMLAQQVGGGVGAKAGGGDGGQYHGPPEGRVPANLAGGRAVIGRGPHLVPGNLAEILGP